MFPDGSRSHDGKLHEGHGGRPGWRAKRGAAVVPVGLIGTAAVRPLSHLLPGRPCVEVRFGEPRDLADLRTVPDGRAGREITVGMMAPIARMSGQKPSGSVDATSRD